MFNDSACGDLAVPLSEYPKNQVVRRENLRRLGFALAAQGWHGDFLALDGPTHGGNRAHACRNEENDNHEGDASYAGNRVACPFTHGDNYPTGSFRVVKYFTARDPETVHKVESGLGFPIRKLNLQ